MKSGSEPKRLQTGVSGSQVALTLILLGVAGAAVAGFKHMTSMNLSYDPYNVGFVGLPLKREPTKNQ